MCYYAFNYRLNEFNLNKDCVDNFDSSVFTYNPCENDTLLYKCMTKGNVNFGRCFNKSITNGNKCDDFATNNSIGYWKSSFPSQDYWT